jgi:hypothetical protein
LESRLVLAGDLARVAQGQDGGLQRTDAVHARGRLQLVEQAVVALAATGDEQQTHPVIPAQRLDPDARAARQRPDPERVFRQSASLRHANPLWHGGTRNGDDTASTRGATSSA